MWKIELYLIQRRTDLKRAMLEYFKDSTDESDYQDLTDFVEILRKNFLRTDFIDSFQNELLKAKTQKFDVDEVNKHIKSINCLHWWECFPFLIGFLTNSVEVLTTFVLKEEKTNDKATILSLQNRIGLLEIENKLLTNQLVDYLDIS